MLVKFYDCGAIRPLINGLGGRRDFFTSRRPDLILYSGEKFDKQGDAKLCLISSMTVGAVRSTLPEAAA
jgi:hypothetical protein